MLDPARVKAARISYIPETMQTVFGGVNAAYVRSGTIAKPIHYGEIAAFTGNNRRKAGTDAVSASRWVCTTRASTGDDIHRSLLSASHPVGTKGALSHGGAAFPEHFMGAF